MKNIARLLVFSLLLLLCPAWANAQQGTALRFFAGTLLQRPTSCRTADLYYATNTALLYICTATDTWGTGLAPSPVAGATTALDNLASVSINTSLLAQTGVDAGSTTKPFRNVFLYGGGTYGTTYLEITGTPTGTRVWTLPDSTDTFVGLAATQTLTNKTITQLSVNAAAAGISLTLSGTAPTAVGSGTGTAAGALVSGTGPAGGATSDTAANARGGAGSNWLVTLGAGGAQTGASSGTARGGTGGGYIFTSGTGGNATAVTGTVGGGIGGQASLVSGAGGTSATSTGGVGGTVSLLGGNGGISSATAASGAGGPISITGGNGAANSTSGGTAGAGGAVTIDAGTAGAASGGATAAGNGALNLGITNAVAVTIGNTTASTQTLIKSPQVLLNNAAYFSCTALTTNGSGLIGCTASDASIKHSINPFKGGLASIRAIQPQTFRYLDSTSYGDGGQLHLGFVAQNLQNANPLFASRMGSGLLQPEPLAIQAATVSAVQELDAKITKLTTLVEAQQKEINRLKRHRR